MSIWDVLVIGFGLAMDAFAVSVCKGLAMRSRDGRKAAVIGGYFAAFQMLMPLIGYFAGARFSAVVESVDHWIAFVLLALIGGLMIRESFHPEAEQANDDVSLKVMLPLAVATSIDALVTGVTFAFMAVNIWSAAALIGAVTFVICVSGVFLGHLAGEKLESRAKLLGGIVLILIGGKILLEHLAGLA